MTKFLYYLNVFCILYNVIVIALSVSVWDEPLPPASVWGALLNVFAALILIPDLIKKR